jgi:hypothetical protein
LQFLLLESLAAFFTKRQLQLTFLIKKRNIHASRALAVFQNAPRSGIFLLIDTVHGFLLNRMQRLMPASGTGMRGVRLGCAWAF